ncbi:major facilitator superfamily domain-containing protein [Syncephalis plumigaleata]|nr:major facilitator superfamily domain-containing protein [Syncephalis plumigaleata]
MEETSRMEDMQCSTLEHNDSAQSKSIASKANNDEESTAQTNIEADASNQIDPLSWPKLIFLFSGLSVIIFVSSLDQTIVATAIPSIISEFNSLVDVSWVGSAYLLTTAAVTPLYGKLTTIFGLRNVFVFAIAMFLIGSLGCALSTNMVMLIAFRGLSGIGGETVTTPARSAILQSWLGAVFAISAGIGPLLGGVFSDYVSWRWAFYINLPLGFIGLIVLYIGFRPAPIRGSVKDKLARIDYTGACLLMVAVTTLLLGTSWGGNRFAWNSPVVISLLCVSVVICALFIWVEGWQAKEPFTPGYVLKSRNVALTMVSSFLAGWIIFAIVYYYPLFYQLARKKSAVDASVMIIPMMLISFVCLTISTILIGRLNAWALPTFFSGGFICTALAFGLSLTFTETSNLSVEIVVLIVGGIGLGIVWQGAYLSAQVSADPKDIAVVTMCMLGATVGLSISGSVFTNAVSTYTDGQIIYAHSASQHASMFMSPVNTHTMNMMLTNMAFTENVGIAMSLNGTDQAHMEQQQMMIQGIVKAFHIFFTSLIPPAIIAAIVAALLRPRRWLPEKENTSICTEKKG